MKPPIEVPHTAVLAMRHRSSLSNSPIDVPGALRYRATSRERTTCRSNRSPHKISRCRRPVQRNRLTCTTPHCTTTPAPHFRHHYHHERHSPSPVASPRPTPQATAAFERMKLPDNAGLSYHPHPAPEHQRRGLRLHRPETVRMMAVDHGNKGERNAHAHKYCKQPRRDRPSRYPQASRSVHGCLFRMLLVASHTRAHLLGWGVRR